MKALNRTHRLLWVCLWCEYHRFPSIETCYRSYNLAATLTTDFADETFNDPRYFPIIGYGPKSGNQTNASTAAFRSGNIKLVAKG